MAVGDRLYGPWSLIVCMALGDRLYGRWRYLYDRWMFVWELEIVCMAVS